MICAGTIYTVVDDNDVGAAAGLGEAGICDA